MQGHGAYARQYKILGRNGTYPVWHLPRVYGQFRFDEHGVLLARTPTVTSA